MMFHPIPLRLLSSEQKSRALSTSRTENQIIAYKKRKIESRNQVNHKDPRLYEKKKYKVKASDFGQVFEAAQVIFRKSLAFSFGGQVTPRPHRAHLNDLFRSSLKKSDYLNAKRDDIKKRKYVSSYSVPRKVQSFLLQL